MPNLEDNANSENEKPPSIEELLDNPPDKREKGVSYLGDDVGQGDLRAAHNEPKEDLTQIPMTPVNRKSLTRKILYSIIIAGVIGPGVIVSSYYITKNISQYYGFHNITNPPEVQENRK